MMLHSPWRFGTQLHSQCRSCRIGQANSLLNANHARHHRAAFTACRAKGGRKQKPQRQPDFTPGRAPDVGPPPAEDITPATPSLRTSPSLQQQREQGLTSSSSSSSSSIALQSAPAQANPLQVAWRRVLRELSSLPRAIGIMFAIAGFSGLGTVLPQNKSYDFYMENYPDGPGAVLGLLTYQRILALQLDHIYTAWWFYALLGLLAASLTACTITRQWPVVKVAQRWRFQTRPQALAKLGRGSALPSARLSDLGASLQHRNYEVFLKDGSLYAFKGLAGRMGPIGVHAALLLILGGTAWSGFGGWKGAAMCPEGQAFLVRDYMRSTSPLSAAPSGANALLRVNSFDIDTRPDGSVAQFYSDLSLLDASDGTTELLRKRISVNDPFRYGGVTMYQTDWSLAALTLRVAGGEDAQRVTQLMQQLEAASQPASDEAADAAARSEGAASTSSSSGGSGAAAGGQFNMPLASLEGKPGVPEGAKLWATFLPVDEPSGDGSPPRGVSMIARDLQSVVFYDSKGAFVGVRRPGSGKAIEVEGLQLVLDQVIGSTGLELKSDPGVPFVYAGFGGLMITTLVSYVSHSQVWALQQGADVYVAGRSNRSKTLFDKELDEVLDDVPEVAPMPTYAVAAEAPGLPAVNGALAQGATAAGRSMLNGSAPQNGNSNGSGSAPEQDGKVQEGVVVSNNSRSNNA